MSARLIYHTPDSMAGGTSPFDDAILEMVEGQDVRIACPYLGSTYLQRIVDRGTGWRLLTDVQEWVASHAEESRARVIKLVLANRDHIRHCKDLHAKVLIAGRKALVGSANLTQKGVTSRVEMSVLFDDCEQVEELRAWFEFLWDRTAPVTEGDLRACVATMSPLTPALTASPLPCIFPGVASTLQQTNPIGVTPDAEERLLARLRLAPNREWAESWLNLVNELVEATGLSNDDPRLVMSLPQSKFLPITINRRYVLTAFRIEEGHHEKRYLLPDYSNPPGHAVVELILPGWMKTRINKLPGVIRHSSFDATFTGESAGNVPRFVSFSMTSKFTFSPEVLDAWQQALVAECNHQRLSNYRKYHEPVVYRAATDLDYRRRLLDRASPESI